MFSLAAGFGVAFGFLAHRQWKRRGHLRPRMIWRAFTAGDLLRHRSTRADMFYFGVNIFVTGIFIGWACLGVMEISQATESGLGRLFGVRAPVEAPDWAMRAIVTAVGFFAYEFGYWFDHYLKHRIPLFWEMHKTHHTAERLTPLTVWRVHPLDSLLYTNVVTICVGFALGAASFALGAHFPAYGLGGTNILLVAFFFIFVHLQHSQVWLPLTGALGKTFMSPAHHQIHHSVDPAHYNSNLGNALAIYDWLFGTLVMPPKENPHLAYGVLEHGVDHHSVTQLLVTPVAKVIQALIPHEAPPPVAGLEKSANVSR